MRLTTAVVAAALVAVTACGSTETASPEASRIRTITPERAAKVAAAGVARAADLPGYKAQSDDDSSGAPDSSGYGSCLRSFDDYLAYEYKDFAKGNDFVSSYVGVATNADQVAEEVAYIRSAEFKECFERFVTALLAADIRLAVVRYASRLVPITVPRADAAFAVSIRLTAQKYSTNVPVRMFFAGATTGHAAVQVLTIGIKSEGPSVATLAALLAKGVARARAAERAPGAL